MYSLLLKHLALIWQTIRRYLIVNGGLEVDVSILTIWREPLAPLCLGMRVILPR